MNANPRRSNQRGTSITSGMTYARYEADDCCGSGVSEPLDLLALYPCGPTQAHKH